MGRLVYEDENFVWKYAFARQGSEQYRIANELGIGEYTELLDQPIDQLYLTYQDIPSLEAYLASNNYEGLKEEYLRIGYDYEGITFYFEKERVLAQELTYEEYLEAFEKESWGYNGEASDQWFRFCKSTDFDFLNMIAAYVSYMKANPKEEYYFEGEF